MKKDEYYQAIIHGIVDTFQKMFWIVTLASFATGIILGYSLRFLIK